MDGAHRVNPLPDSSATSCSAEEIHVPRAEPDVVARLFDEHGAGLLRYLGRRSGADVAEDLVGDTFAVVVEQFAVFDPTRGAERSWIYGIATNLLRHHLRSQARRDATVVRSGRPDVDSDVLDERVADRIDAQRRVRQLSAAIQGLTDEDRDVLLLMAWGGLTATEVADVLGIPAGTVRSRLHRTRRQLRTAAPQINVPNVWTES